MEILSPSLFILMVEVLSRALNDLFSYAEFRGYSLSKWSEQINHLLYVDDTIIFVKVHSDTLKLLMQTLSVYETQSG